MEPLKVKVIDIGIAAEHNMPCPICRENKAVLRMWTDTFGPCWDCASKGWLTLRARPWQLWLLKRIFGATGDASLHNVG